MCLSSCCTFVCFCALGHPLHLTFRPDVARFRFMFLITKQTCTVPVPVPGQSSSAANANRRNNNVRRHQQIVCPNNSGLLVGVACSARPLPPSYHRIEQVRRPSKIINFCLFSFSWPDPEPGSRRTQPVSSSGLFVLSRPPEFPSNRIRMRPADETRWWYNRIFHFPHIHSVAVFARKQINHPSVRKKSILLSNEVLSKLANLFSLSLASSLALFPTLTKGLKRINAENQFMQFHDAKVPR